MTDKRIYNEQFRKWKYDDLPIVPQEWQFIVASGKEQQFSILKDLMHRSDVTEIINACDSGREGELIFRFVYEQANCKKPFSRLWISSMEASAIREGFSNLKDGRGYDNLYQSALHAPPVTSVPKERTRYCPVRGMSRLGKVLRVASN